jgi:hypothetical protein
MFLKLRLLYSRMRPCGLKDSHEHFTEISHLHVQGISSAFFQVVYSVVLYSNCVFHCAMFHPKHATI